MGSLVGAPTMIATHPGSALRSLAVVWTILASTILARAQATPAPHMQFREIGHQAGLTTVPSSAPDKRYLIETMGGGIALFDCDNDGKLDILVVRDSTIDHYLHGGDLMVTLYR